MKKVAAIFALSASAIVSVVPYFYFEKEMWLSVLLSTLMFDALIAALWYAVDLNIDEYWNELYKKQNKNR